MDKFKLTYIVGGLGTGKSIIARGLAKELKELGLKVTVLDDFSPMRLKMRIKRAMKSKDAVIVTVAECKHLLGLPEGTNIIKVSGC